LVACSVGVSRDPEAAGVRDGECTVDDRGLSRGEGRPEDEWVRCWLGSPETFSSLDGTYVISGSVIYSTPQKIMLPLVNGIVV
jgi:hypothetical protein